MLHTTFALVKKAGACTTGYRAGARALGGIPAYGRDTPIPLTRILELRGVDDAVWCLCCVLPEERAWRDRLARLVACDYAEHVMHLWVAPAGVDWKPVDSIEITRRYANGQASEEELIAASAAATVVLSKLSKFSVPPLELEQGWDAWRIARAARSTMGQDAGVVAYQTARMARDMRRSEATEDAEREWQAARFREMLDLEAP